MNDVANRKVTVPPAGAGPAKTAAAGALSVLLGTVSKLPYRYMSPCPEPPCAGTVPVTVLPSKLNRAPPLGESKTRLRCAPSKPKRISAPWSLAVISALTPPANCTR